MTGVRLDYVYLSPSLVPFVEEARVVRDDYTKPKPAAVNGFFRPSDHLPILIIFRSGNAPAKSKRTF